MKHVRLGYACVNLSLGEKGRTSRTCRLSNATPVRLEELARANLAGLREVLHWNAAHEIMIFRISSGIIPLASHPNAKWSWQEKLGANISTLGNYVREHGMRLSMHPGQYVVLNSQRANVVWAAVNELSYHADFLNAMGLTPEHKITLHVGGVYGDRHVSLQRFGENFHNLPENVKSRLVIENDEHNYGADEVLGLCESLNVPMVFDHLHHQAYSKRPMEDDLMDRVCATWSRVDGSPEMHYSTQRSKSRRGAHADMINAGDFRRFLNMLPDCNVDFILEAKAKDKALLKLREDLHSGTGMLDVTVE